MSIVLAAELLIFMAQHRKRFENECKKTRLDLLNLGKMFLSKVEDERYYESLMMDRDFKDRSILKIVTENYFESLLHGEDPKGENLIIKLWHGSEASRCDGNIYGFSCLTHVLMTAAKKNIPGTPFYMLISNHFEFDLKKDYNIQYRYRTKSISFFFMKEFCFALAVLVIFQYINYDYLNLFQPPSQYLMQVNTTAPMNPNDPNSPNVTTTSVTFTP